MKRIVAIALAILVGTVYPPVASADSGQYYDSDGLSCNWTGFGSTYMVQCWGTSRAAGGYTNYSCTVTVSGSMQRWDCRSQNGATWSGSR